jgi:hypothetical protein
MPSIRQSANVDMTGWEPAPPNPRPQGMTANDPNPQRNPAMLASMPAMASTADAFQRQFYGGANIPAFRILPGRRGGGV